MLSRLVAIRYEYEYDYRTSASNTSKTESSSKLHFSVYGRQSVSVPYELLTVQCVQRIFRLQNNQSINHP